MKYVYTAVLLLFCLATNAQGFRKTNFTAPLKGTASFADPKYINYEPQLIHLDQHPVPFAEYGNKKELANKKRRETVLPQVSNKTAGVAPNPTVLKVWQGNFGSGTPFDNDVSVSNGGLILSTVNANIRVFDTAGVSLLSQNINTMDSVTGVFSWISDPRTLYDPKTDRFIMVCFSGALSTSSKIILGFSTTNNPADDWNFYTLNGNPFNDSTWSDYPIIAISDKDFFMTFNQIKDNIGWQTGFRQSVIYQIKKDDGHNGNALNYTLWDSLKYNGVNYRNICPARYNEANMGDDMYFLSVRNVDMSNDSVFVLHISDSYQSNNATLTHQVLKSPVSYGFPPNPKMKNGQYLMTNDGRILSAMYENNRIHFGANSVHPTYNNAGVFLGEIQNPGPSATITADVLGKPNQEFGYPSMTYMGTSPGENKVLYTFGHCYTDSFPGISMLYKNANGYSDIVDVVIGTSPFNLLADSNERWGDYSGVQKFYNDPTRAVLVGCIGSQNGSRARVAHVHNAEFALSTDNVSQNIQEINVFPNPSKDRFTTRFSIDQQEKVRFSLYDMNGRLLKVMFDREVKKGMNEFSFSTSTLSKGMYLFTIDGAQKRWVSEKLIIE